MALRGVKEVHKVVFGLSTTDTADSNNKSVNETTGKGSVKNIDDGIVNPEVPIVTGPEVQKK